MFVDGRDRIDVGCDCQAVIHGDAIVASIAAASIVAKVTRDRLMTRLALAHPGYGFERHMGYSVPEHFAALATARADHPSPPLVLAGGRALPGESGADARRNPAGRVASASGTGPNLLCQVGVASSSAGAMLYVSIFVELLRSRPALAVWIAALAQAALWTLVPTLFYSGPPGDLPFVLAIGNELQLGTYLGPPLAFWLAEGAYMLAGNSLFGVYLLSQVCVVVTYWAVFALGRSIVGAQHAALAVLLMVGISAFTVPTPDFGPVTLTMALWSVILLHYWRAVSEGRRGYWVALAVEIGLLFLTTYAGLLLLAVLALFTATNKRARAAMRSSDPWLASLVAIVVLFPHLLWLSETGEGLLPRLMRLRTPESVIDNFNAWLRQIAFILAAHAGLAVLVSAVVGWPWTRREPSPVIVREPVEPFARQFIIYFAIAPALAATIVAVLAGWPAPVGGMAPLVVLSGLAVCCWPAMASSSATSTS